MTGLYIFYSITVVAGAAFFTRNHAVYRVRSAFIDDPELWPEGYRALPSYDEMMWHPKHWHLWTFSQWRDAITKELQ